MSTMKKLGVAGLAIAGLAFAGCANSRERRAERQSDRQERKADRHAEKQAEKDQAAMQEQQAQAQAAPPPAEPAPVPASPAETIALVENAEVTLDAAQREFGTSGNSDESRTLTNAAVEKIDKATQVADQNCQARGKDLKAEVDALCTQHKVVAQGEPVAAEAPGAEAQEVVTPPADGAVVVASFDTAQAKLTPEMKKQLDGVVEQLKSSGSSIWVEGHTDSSGTEAFNEELSMTRATAVKDYLVQQGINVDRIQVKGVGEREPAYPNDSPDNMAKNRRIEAMGEGLKPVS